MKHYSCSYIGVSGTTNIYVEKVQSSEIGEEIWEARMGISIMGYTNHDNRVSNPFDNRWRDNYVKGFGTSENKAIDALKKEA